MAENNSVTTSKKGFQKGKSGNPGGRPKKSQEEIDLVAACKEKTPEALRVIESIMIDPASNERNRITAAQYIIDRAYGKAVQAVDANINGKLDGLVQFVIVDANPESGSPQA